MSTLYTHIHVFAYYLKCTRRRNLEDREKITEYQDITAMQEILVTGYDLYSESKLSLDQ
ncbi:hypothetical protein [Fulvivirga sp.]|uniref:hypothetical protein n=1 Tax=Fulvivirga sp. TaxID=1931237 RepID=UPI0032EADA62